jgi:hypothetical protein
MNRAIFDNLVTVAPRTLQSDSPLIFFMQCTTAPLWYAGLPLHVGFYTPTRMRRQIIGLILRSQMRN